MIKLVKRLMQKPYEAKNKTDYIRQKLKDGYKISQLELMDLCQRDGVPHMYTVRLSGRIHDLKKEGMNIKKEPAGKGRTRYVRYYL